MATTIKLSIDDLEFIPAEREGDRHELIDGELFVTPVPIIKHQDCSENIADALRPFIRRQRLGKLYATPTGVRLASDTLVIPDICFVAQHRLDIIGTKTIDGLPDLVVEILSPGTRRRDLALKRHLYERFGVPEYWIVDPDAKTVLVLVLEGDRYRELSLRGNDVIVSRVLPGFELGLGEVFADIP